MTYYAILRLIVLTIVRQHTFNEIVTIRQHAFLVNMYNRDYAVFRISACIR